VDGLGAITRADLGDQMVDMAFTVAALTTRAAAAWIAREISAIPASLVR
jgi:hypothetical protein